MITRYVRLATAEAIVANNTTVETQYVWKMAARVTALWVYDGFLTGAFFTEIAMRDQHGWVLGSDGVNLAAIPVGAVWGGRIAGVLARRGRVGRAWFPMDKVVAVGDRWTIDVTVTNNPGGNPVQPLIACEVMPLRAAAAGGAGDAVAP